MLEARSLTVARGRRTILTGVDLSLRAGEAVHLRGANGSGKTSLLRVLAGLSAPRAGQVRREGRVAYVPEKVTLAGALQAGEWLAAMRRLRGGAPVSWEDAAAASGLDPAVLRHASATLSKGMLQRIALLEALHADCALLLLDEPFAGLDPGGRDWMGERLAQCLGAGAAVLLTDHSEAAGERLAPTVSLVVEGGAVRTAAASPPRVASPPAAPSPPRAAIAASAAAEVLIAASHRDGRHLHERVDVAASDARLRALLADGWHIEGVSR